MDCDSCEYKKNCSYRARGELCPEAREARDSGRLVGGASGAIIGGIIGGPAGVVIGGAVGALLGGAMGEEGVRKHKKCKD
ncbi:MAG: glycine zipper domain-containing protein [Promethearchaeota archaeon]